jgi:hypothetical protein
MTDEASTTIAPREEDGAVAPEATEDWREELTPREIVKELDKYIVGQDDAKKAVAIALRNRWRRQKVEEELREEILPNNLILIGPTGVGKTEISRRLARLAGAPFVKVEASKFTEVGYVGRDVESMIRDLVDTAVNMVRAEREARRPGAQVSRGSGGRSASPHFRGWALRGEIRLRRGDGGGPDPPGPSCPDPGEVEEAADGGCSRGAGGRSGGLPDAVH